MVYKEESGEGRFIDIKEFVSGIEKKGEVEFIYKDNRYSVTHPSKGICFTDMASHKSAFFGSVEDLLQVDIDGKDLSEIICEIYPYFIAF